MCQESNISYSDNSNISLEPIQSGGKFGGNHLNEREWMFLNRTILGLLIIDMKMPMWERPAHKPSLIL